MSGEMKDYVVAWKNDRGWTGGQMAEAADAETALHLVVSKEAGHERHLTVWVFEMRPEEGRSVSLEVAVR